MSFDKLKYNSGYNRDMYMPVSMRIRRNDPAVVWLRAHPAGVTGYIMGLIRADMKKEARRKDTINGPTFQHNRIEMYRFEHLGIIQNTYVSMGYFTNAQDAKADAKRTGSNGIVLERVIAEGASGHLVGARLYTDVYKESVSDGAAAK